MFPEAQTPAGGEAATQASQSSGGGVNVAAIVVPIVLGVVLLAAIAGVATYLVKSRYCPVACDAHAIGPGPFNEPCSGLPGMPC